MVVVDMGGPSVGAVVVDDGPATGLPGTRERDHEAVGKTALS
jgi:hypothetical protein